MTLIPVAEGVAFIIGALACGVVVGLVAVVIRVRG